MGQLSTGQRVDRYIVEGRIGEGGMAVVYRVRHATLGTPHALKVLSITSTDVRERLVREGQVQAKLHHENVVQVTDVISVSGQPGLLMGFVEGPSLESWLVRYRPTLDEAVAVFRGVCAGVGYAHTRGLIHRDLKPANVLLALSDDRLVPKVADFGLAKDLAREKPGKGRPTRIGSTMGTPGYMAPEQMRDASSVDRRADLWSLGCILYRLLSGVAPFDGDDMVELFKLVASGDYVSTRRLCPDLPERLHVIVERLLSVDVQDRVADCGAVIRYLDENEDLLEPPSPGELPEPTLPWTERPRWLSSQGAAGIAAREIADETLVHLPKLGRDAGDAGWTGSDAYDGTTLTPVLDEEPTAISRPPSSPLALAPTEEDLPQARRRPGVAVALSLFVALGAAAAMVSVGVIGMVLIVQAGAPTAIPPIAAVPPSPLTPLPAPAPSPAPAAAPAVSPEPLVGGAHPEPAPEPAPAPAGTRPRPVPRGGTGRVVFSGVDRLWLKSKDTGEEVHELSAVAPGHYQVVALFPNVSKPAGSGEVVVRAGQTLELVCVPDFAQCREQ